MHTIERVREFHEKFEHPIADKLTESTDDIRRLRLKLIAEEVAELAEALGYNLAVVPNSGRPGHSIFITQHYPTYPPNMVEVADALGDIDYVVQGANLVFGIPSEAVSAAIHKSNMTKLGDDGKPIKSSDGKIVKGPNYAPPTDDIRTLLGV